MSEFSSLTHKFRAHIDGLPSSVNNKINKRNRQPLSCVPCRLRKLKCDRGHPCEACLKRSDESSCSYGKGSISKPSDLASNGNHINPNKRGRAQEKLRNLEQLVMQMVDQQDVDYPSDGLDGAGGNESTTGINSVSTNNRRDGRLQNGPSEAQYTGSTHWSAILENLQELKSEMSANQAITDQPSSTEMDESEDVDSPQMDNLFSSTSQLSLSQILAQALPPRLQVDRRLSTYFNSNYLVIPFVHTQQFQRQYERFWLTPLETPPLWISMLFSICALSAGLSEVTGSEPSTPEDQISPRANFLQAACQCLRLGGYTRPQRHVLEALGLYCQCLYASTLDPSGDVGVMFAIVVRLAYRSGYHRDPSHFPHISVFEGEMRRRVWAMCRQMDLMVAFQLGLPNQIPPNSWDTLNPRNLLDTDFDEDIKALPASRPETEATRILYFIVKSRLMTTFGKVCANALSFGSDDSMQQVMELDREVRATYETIPKVLHAKPMSQSFADPSYLTMVRTNCEFLYRKSLLVLHRKYMTQQNMNHPSVKACTDAAIAIIKHMLDLNKEFKPGGQLFQDRWMMTSFTLNDFYLAGMILCLRVSMWQKTNPGKDISQDELMREQYIMLQESLSICEEKAVTSSEAKRVTQVLKVVLGPKPSTGKACHSAMPGQPRGTPSSSTQSRPTVTSNMSSMQFDFNLTPLTLQGEGRVKDSMSDASPATAVPQANQPQSQSSDGSNNDAQMDIDGVSMNGFADLMPGINNPNTLGENSFLSFFPFSPAYGPSTPFSKPTPTSQPLNPNTTADNTIDDFGLSPSMAMNVDWPLIDQWMAFPNPADIMPFNDSGTFMSPAPAPAPAPTAPTCGVVSGTPGSIFADVRSDVPYPPLADVREMGNSDIAGAKDTQWTSTPLEYLGKESRGVDTDHHRPSRTNGTGNGPDLNINGRSQEQYPMY